MNDKICKVFKAFSICFTVISLVCVALNFFGTKKLLIKWIENATNSSFECEVDCCFSIGQNCKTAYHIDRHGKRFQAAPLDWMRDYSLDTVLHLFESKFSDFFEEIDEVEPWPGEVNARSVKDTKNGILSIHHFLYGKPLDEEKERFRNTMKHRAKKVDEIIQNSDSVALIYSREDLQHGIPDNKKFIDFAKKFSKIYPGKKIYFIIVKISNINGIQRHVLFKKDNVKVVSFTFYDVGTDWTGNHNMWDKVMNHIKLVKES